MLAAQLVVMAALGQLALQVRVAVLGQPEPWALAVPLVRVCRQLVQQGSYLQKRRTLTMPQPGSTPPTVAASGVVSVLVSTGSEARPTADTVLWIGGSTQPTNMADGDLWFSPNESTDITAPTAPTDLQSSGITSSTFTLSWTAASDAVGVTAYEVFLDGISYAIVTSTSANISGRVANHAYVCTVRARDATGNWGPLSSSITVTTSASSSLTHTVWGSTMHPALGVYNDGTSMRLATAFMTTAANWKAAGVRLYVPAGAAVQSSCTVYLFLPASGAVPDLGSPAATALMTGITPGQWNEVNFSTSYAITQDQIFFVGYSFSNGAYLSSNAVGNAAVQALDGSALYMTASNLWAGVNRQYYSWNDGVNVNASTIDGQTYGLDVIVSEV